MARPTKTQVLTGEYSLNGSPHVNVATKSAIDLDTLEYTLDGSPWYGTEETSAPAPSWLASTTISPPRNGISPTIWSARTPIVAAR